MPFNFSFRKPKTYLLMHKNIPVLSAEYDMDKAEFTKLLEVSNFEHVPYSAREDNTGSQECSDEV